MKSGFVKVVKKTGMFILTVALVLAFSLSLAACSGTPSKLKSKVKSKDVYVMSAVSSVGYLNQTDTKTRAFNMGAINAATEEAPTTGEEKPATGEEKPATGEEKPTSGEEKPTTGEEKPTADPALSRPAELEKDIEQINTYVNMFKGMLISGDTSYQVSTPTKEADGEYASYKTKLSVALPGVGGKTESYAMYFNETPIAAEEDEKEDEDKDKDEKESRFSVVNEAAPLTNENAENKDAKADEKEEEETEVSSTLEGVMVYGDKVFIVSGEKNVETEGTEVETSIEFTTKSKENPTNYIKVNQEMELGEVEYQYSIYENNKLVSQTNLEMESEDGEDELELQFINTANGVATDTIYKIESKKTTDGAVVFEVEYILNGKTSVFSVEIGETANNYVYENGFKESI